MTPERAGACFSDIPTFEHVYTNVPRFKIEPVPDIYAIEISCGLPNADGAFVIYCV